MILRPLIAGLAAFAAFTAAPAMAKQITGPQDCVGGPADPEEWKLAVEVVQVIIPTNDGGAMMRGLMDTIGSQVEQAFPVPDDDPGLKAVLDKKRSEIPDRIMPVLIKHLPSMSNGMACAYVAEFTLAELQELAVFARSPTGKRYLSRSTALIGDPSVAAANQAYFQDINPVAQEYFLDVKEAVSDYLAKKKKR